MRIGNRGLLVTLSLAMLLLGLVVLGPIDVLQVRPKAMMAVLQ